MHQNSLSGGKRRPGIALVLAVALGASVTTGCVSDAELEAAQLREARAEAVIAEIEAEPPSEVRDAELAEARRVERAAELRRIEMEGQTAAAWIERGTEAVGHGVGGDIPGGVGVLGAGALAALIAWVRRRFSKADLATDEKIERRLTALEARRDASRNAQGIAPSTAGSAEAAKSPVAHAVSLAAQTDLQRQIDATLAARLTPQAPLLAPQAAPAPQPAPPAARTPAEGLSGGAGVPRSWPMPPGYQA